MERTNFLDLPNCFRLTNDRIEIVVTTDAGPRIVFYGFAGGENILGEHPHAAVPTALGEWKPYGGHRLWAAPENMPNSYAPDNAPVEYSFDEPRNSVRLIQPLEPVTETQKEIVVTLAPTGSRVEINHKITNRGRREIELAPWALTIMRGGGEAIIPNEPFEPYGAETLLPARSFAVWSYTDFADSRWTFERGLIRLRVDETKGEPQKIGVLNKQGWAAYQWQDLLFVKRFDFVEAAVYPDLNSNTEVYTAGAFVEVETLAPLQKLQPNETAEHVERWQLLRADNPNSAELLNLISNQTNENE